MSEEYDALCASNELLNTVLDNVDAGIMLLDDDFAVLMVNATLLRLFRTTRECIRGMKCGNALGCIHSVLENRFCGETSHCEECGLRSSVLDVLKTGEPSGRSRLKREFVLEGAPTRMFLELSTKRIELFDSQMVLVVLYDVSELEENRRALQESNSQLEQDIAAASEIQRSLLPSASPITRALRFGWHFLPYAGVGGDLFNVALLDETRVGLFMLDVCGHGVPAAMITVSVSRMLQPETGMLYTPGAVPLAPSQVLSILDREYPFERFGSYFTILYMVVDTARGEIAWSSAGHPWPILARKEGRDTSTQILESKGPAIGIGAKTPFSDHHLHLFEGDRVILYTDGILEQADEKGEHYGEERLLQAVGHTASLGTSEAMDAIVQDVLDFGGGLSPQDDIALLGFDYIGSKS
ncbi:MAG: SpoIIE family protein phosphatase [Oceanidesulfovibrio sp.]